MQINRQSQVCVLTVMTLNAMQPVTLVTAHT